VVIAQNSDNLYSKLLTIGFAAMFLFHIFENIGMTIGVMPITGIPLPFFSYGGTFQIINLISIGLIISSSIQKDPLNFI
ncbi:MAG: FtsW/RodA/SpoVE family cell cycle protein, partial [Finegoldia magna]|nr:FtsW/RodA/SpoVE family cell cycle protein [Finegoldia magna]